MSSVINVVATIIAHPGYQDEVKAAVLQAEQAVQGEDGCEHYQLFADIQRPGHWVFIERWRDEAALEQHNGAPSVQQLGLALNGHADIVVRRLQPAA